MSMNKMNSIGRSNQFMETVNRIAEKHRLSPRDSRHIMSLAKGFSSADFCIDSQSNDSLCVLPQIIVDDLREHYDLHSHGPFRLHSGKHVDSNQKAIVFIRTKLTKQLLDDQFILEHFDSAQRLHQFLKWTIRISKMAQTMALMEGRNRCNVLVVHSELHDQRGRDLYVLCIPNDITSSKAQKWQLTALLTAPELTNLLGVNSQSLPRGVRATSFQFERHRRMFCGNNSAEALRRKKGWITQRDSMAKVGRYQHLRCVHTNAQHRVSGSKIAENALEIGLSDFHSMVRSALEDDEVELIPMASIVVKRARKTRKESFSVDYMLPVQIGRDWVGVVYRDGAPTQALMDCYDITNKALLCDPSFDAERVAMFHRNPTYNRLKVVPDDHCESMYSITDTLQSTQSPEPTFMEMSPTVSAVPSYTRSLTDTSSICSISLVSCTPSIRIVPTLLPTVTLIPCLPLSAMGVYPQVELMQWVDQVVAHGKHTAAYFGQFVDSSARF